MRHLSGVKAFADHVAGAVHTSVADDELAARHRAFIASHLLAGILPFACLPVLLALAGAPSAFEIVAFAWLVAPIAVAFDLSRTGDLGRAHLLSSLSIVGLVAMAAAATGGLASPAVPFLALAVLEAGLSGSRRTIAVGVLAAASALSVLHLLGAASLLPSASAGASLAVVGAVGAMVYTAALALRAAAIVRASERDGRDGRARIELLAGSVGDLITRHEPNGDVVFASASAAALLGATARDLLGRGLLDRVHVADRPAFLHGLAGGPDLAAPKAVELRIRRDAGVASDFVWVEMRSRRAPLQEAGAGGASASILAAFRDISDRKVHEAELLAAREEAERASAAKTRFVATMSHELRTPLNAIIGFSEVLADETLMRLTAERRREYAGLIHESGAHLLDVVNGILDMSKIESGNFAIYPEPCPIAPIVRSCAGLLGLRAEQAGVALNVTVAAGLPDILADRRALTQVLLNLVSNAVKFTPRGGSVVIDAQAGGFGVVLTVRDNGVGMAPEHVARLGEAFFQVRGSYDHGHDGAGLGLSVVRGLVDLHGGRLAVESALGVGTKVAVSLPLDCERAALGRGTPRPVVAASAAAPAERPALRRAEAPRATFDEKVRRIA